MRLLPFALLIAACASAVTRTAASGDVPGKRPQQAEPPTLVVAIVVDQMRGDYAERFGGQWRGGLERLMREGAVFSNAHQDHAVTVTAPGHASVLSGRYPAHTGILRNGIGVGDTASPLVGGSGPGASPSRFNGTTLFDWMKTRWPGARAFGAGGDDRNVIPVLGWQKELVFWSPRSQFVTSTFYADSLPAWVTAFNREALPAVSAPGRVWSLLREPAAYPEPDSAPWENRGDHTFPHTGPADSADAIRNFRYMPWGDSLTLAFALRGVNELGLGRGPAPDLMVLGLATADDIGHAYGPDSRELRDYYLRLDQWLGTFLDSLQRLHGTRKMVVVLTSDHGITPFPEAAWARGDSTPRHVRLDTLLRRWEAKLDTSLGAGNYTQFGDGMVALNRRVLESRGVRMDTLLAQIGADLRRIPGVARVQTLADLHARVDTTRDAGTRRWRRSLVPALPAELMLTLTPGSDFSTGASAQHGQNSDLDTHVALIFWGSGIQPGRHGQKAAVVDIAPTLARIMGLEPAERLDGRVLSEILTTDGAR